MAYNNRLTRATANEIPVEVQREVISAVIEDSAAMRLAKRVAMPSHTVTMPVKATYPEAYWLNGASRNAEDVARKQTTTMTWDNVNLSVAEIAVLVPVPDALVQDQLFDLMGQIMPEITASIGVAIDNAVLWGDGKPTLWSGGAGVGIYDLAVAAGNVVTPATVVEGDATPDLGQQFGEAARKLSLDGFQPTGFAVEPGLDWRLRNLRDTVGQPIYQGQGAGFAGAQPETLFGRNLFQVRNGAWDSTRAVGILGDWNYAMIGVRQDLTFSVHRDGVINDDSGVVVYNSMQQDGAVLRCVMRIGFATANPLTRLNTNSSTRSPFAVVSAAGAPSS